MKFPNNILKSVACSLSVPESERYIITTGSETDTVIFIWSMTGEILTTLNTYQIEHYSAGFGNNTLIVRGWTSEVKIFKITDHKDGNFNKLEKSFHLGSNDHPKCCSIDSHSLYSLTVSKSDQIFLWNLHS
eukprot:GHVR01125713.1.p1 GENE.GHVR01125713.1~~GHVR01125713.1.p1  ORF type:complete len:131 (+),score=3.84 GHVR01125713.1:390-782(+)